ncbi:MAG: putative C-S lyase [Pantoea sp. Brub]|nr:putative C-S lyase [Pantoea sp. Brub]
MSFNFDQHIDRRTSNSLKWTKYKNKDIIPLWIADTDFKTPDCVIEAMRNRIDYGIFGYPNKPNALINIFIQYLKKKFNWDVDEDWIIILPGVVTGLNISARAFTNSNENIITYTPIYPPFRYTAKLSQRDQLCIPLELINKRWLPNFSSVIKKITSKEKLIMLCNPQNPTGTVYKHAELQEQLLFAQKYDLIVCSDEIHCDLILEPDIRHIPFASLSNDAAQRTITFMSPSKTFNIAGLSVSMAIIPNSILRERFIKVRQGIVPEVNVIALAAAEAAFRDGSQWLKEQIIYLRKNRDSLISLVNKFSCLSIIPPEATYLGWINVGKLGKSNPCSYFESHGLGFLSGKDFGDNNFIRFNFGCTYNTLQKAMQRFEKAVKAST